MTWTTEKPTKPGWYWCRPSPKDEAIVVLAYETDDDEL